MRCSTGWSKTVFGSPEKWKTPTVISTLTSALSAGGSSRGTLILLHLQKLKSHHRLPTKIEGILGTLSSKVRSSLSTRLCWATIRSFSRNTSPIMLCPKWSLFDDWKTVATYPMMTLTCRRSEALWVCFRKAQDLGSHFCRWARYSRKEWISGWSAHCFLSSVSSFMAS